MVIYWFGFVDELRLQDQDILVVDAFPADFVVSPSD